MPRAFLFTGIAGTGIEGAVRRLAAEIDASVPVLSIDKFVWGAFRDEARKNRVLRKAAALDDADLHEESSPNWWRFLSIPMDAVRHYWRAGAQRAVESIAAASDGQMIFLTSHAVYQSDKYRWRFSGVDPTYLRDMGLTAVFTLIDDIYDIHFRRSTDLLAAKTSSRRYEKRWQRAQNLLRLTISQLIELLRWRQEEILFSDFLASTLSIRNHVVAIKHPLATGRLLLEDASRSHYFSHPITNVRRDPAFPRTAQLEEISAAAERFRAAVPLIEPTTVDELRFKHQKAGVEMHPLPWLAPRWPQALQEDRLWGVPAPRNGEQSSLCWWADVEDLGITTEMAKLCAGKGPRKIRPAVDTAMNHLLEVITEDITWRDHHLVDQTRRLLVFRPAPDGTLSSGVKRELEYFAKVSGAAGNRNRALVFHPEADRKAHAKDVADQLVKTWQQTPELLRAVRDDAKRLRERSLHEELADVLGNTFTLERATNDCVEVLARYVSIEPSVRDPLPMGTGARTDVVDKVAEVRQRVRDATEKTLLKGYIHGLEAEEGSAIKFTSALESFRAEQY